MVGYPKPDEEIFVPVDLPVVEGPEVAIFCDASGVAEYVTTHDRLALTGTHVGCVMTYGCPVYFGGRLVATGMFEVMTLTVDGVLKQMSGQPSVRVGIKRTAP